MEEIELQKELNKYINLRKSQEECSGFIDGFKLGYAARKKSNVITRLVAWWKRNILIVY